MTCSLVLILAVAVLTPSVTARGTAGHISFPCYNAVQYGTGQGQEHGEGAYLKKRVPEGLEAVQSIANVVLKVLEHETVRASPKNWAVSPVSLAETIAQLLLGSRGRLQTVLRDSLSLQGVAKPSHRLEVHRQLGRLISHLQRRSNETYTMELSAAIFLQPEVKLKQTYKHALLDFYQAQIFAADFMSRSEEATDQINEWIKESTHGKVPSLFGQPLPSMTVALMANVVYFSGNWQTPFDPDYTKAGPFHINDKEDVEVQYMFGEKELLYANTSEMQLIGIPYKKWEVVLYVLIPHSALTTRLSVTRLDEIISTGRRENISLVMPKVKLVSSISVRQSLLKYIIKNDRSATRNVFVSGAAPDVGARSYYYNSGPKMAVRRPPPVTYGYGCSRGARCTTTTTTTTTSTMTKTTSPPQWRPGYLGRPAQTAYTGEEQDGEDDDAEFEKNFDVSGASDDARFAFDDVIHQVSMEIDERGSEIAAVTASLVDYSGDNFILKVDRPFWFFVRHEDTKTHLFWGRIVDPSKDTN